MLNPIKYLLLHLKNFMLITKPTHTKYIFRYLNNTQYTQYARGYSLGKRNDSRGIYLWASGIGVWGIVRETATGGIKCYGKKKLKNILSHGSN